MEQAYAVENKNSARAIKFYLKVLDKVPYLSSAYMGLYRIYRKKGHYLKAKQMLTLALEWTHEIEERKLYKYKLFNLT